MVSSLNPELVIEKVERLQRRIIERFPERNLNQVCGELLALARKAKETSERIAAPNVTLRAIIGLLVVLLGGLLIYGLTLVRLPDGAITFIDLIQIVEPAINIIVFGGAGIFFLINLENRFKQRRALEALHELRKLAHVIDMHQLTKDPARILGVGPRTASSPQEEMTIFELNRYLDYCSEMLSFTSKIATLYVQDFPDAVAVATVNEVEDLTTGLSRKIWQKIMVIQATESP